MHSRLIVANWKMRTTLADAHVLANGILNGVEHMEKIEVVVCPPTIWLAELAHLIPPGRLSHLHLGAQNIYKVEEGAFTGEISAKMVKEVAEYVIVGHSERTHIFKESHELVAEKLQMALKSQLTPILCVGEDRKEADSKRNLVHLLNFLTRELSPAQLERLVVAYEPVWAIGDNNPASPTYAAEIITALRTAVTPTTRILYGGSVDGQDAKGFLEQKELDGFLVGGASLNLKSFLTICQMADDLS